ncbi:hypothetical protein QBC42DRAFT_313743 [Cladorrhinum samala]|uniref:Uncharacterized protein n=1 Tax=Cladorrhinum samala TaxID=585594 RepID=A0AAV9HWS5_9PEZI|nr:hypothetical protein QBC42DRAFT_313743 [Cladorrhinum samala]
MRLQILPFVSLIPFLFSLLLLLFTTRSLLYLRSDTKAKVMSFYATWAAAAVILALLPYAWPYLVRFWTFIRCRRPNPVPLATNHDILQLLYNLETQVRDATSVIMDAQVAQLELMVEVVRLLHVLSEREAAAQPRGRNRDLEVDERARGAVRPRRPSSLPA